MRNTVRSAQKSWRRFARPSRKFIHDKQIRRICAAALLLEAALLVREQGLPAFWTVRLEQTGQEHVSPAEEKAGFLEDIFGIRLRLRDGTIEFYRREERGENLYEDVQGPK